MSTTHMLARDQPLNHTRSQHSQPLPPIGEAAVEIQPTIFVVDDDPAVSRALQSVGQLLDLPVLSFPSPAAFLGSDAVTLPGCLVLDVRMPGMSGLELQQHLIDQEVPLPIIMISGHADVQIAVQAMQHGAVTLLEKPFSLDDITAHIRRGLRIDGQRREALAEQTQTRQQLAQLTRKEREVLELITRGRTNKEIAATLHLSVRAVEDRRSRMMKKLAVRNVIELHRFISA